MDIKIKLALTKGVERERLLNQLEKELSRQGALRSDRRSGFSSLDRAQEIDE